MNRNLKHKLILITFITILIFGITSFGFFITFIVIISKVLKLWQLITFLISPTFIILASWALFHLFKALKPKLHEAHAINKMYADSKIKHAKATIDNQIALQESITQQEDQLEADKLHQEISAEKIIQHAKLMSKKAKNKPKKEINHG